MKLVFPTKTQFFLLFIATFLIRALIFYFYIQHEERYQQADTMDYHNCAIGIAFGTGMHRADNLQPIFWRTPGYPLLLGSVYKACGVTHSHFNKCYDAQKIFLWLQILLSSLTPLMLFYLAFLLTANLLISYILAFVAMIHPGFIVASMYLLTEGIAIIFFYLFLYCFYYSFTAYGEHVIKRRSWVPMIIASAIALALYTWMRPMGEFVAVVATALLLIVSVDSFLLKIKKCALFMLIFALCISPWYVRNYRLTGEWFFCPMSGAYLNSFTAPKILRAITGWPLERAIGLCYHLAQEEAKKEDMLHIDTGYTVPREAIAKRIAWPIIFDHPLIACKEWMQEVIKTTFDLYSYQLTALIAGIFKYDPLEEFLSIKIKDTLWNQPMPWLVRMIAWTEVAWMFFLWIGLIGGFWTYMLVPLFRQHLSPLTGLWIKTAQLIWAVLFMTGGFGYARLRLPIEPLMIMLALTWWIYYHQKNDPYCAS